MSTIYEKTKAGQPAFSTETREGDYLIEYPLGANEPSALVIRARFKQYRANYSRPAAYSSLSYGSSTAYFVDDIDFQDERGGVTSWTRIWATVPASWSEPGGTIAYTFPAYTASLAFGTTFAVSDVVANGANLLVYTNATGISTGEDLYFDINYIRSSQNFHVTMVTPAKGANSGSTVTIGNVLPGIGAFSSVTGTVREGNSGRATPEAIEVDSVLFHDYALAAESNIATVLPQIDKFSPVTSAGVETDTLLTGTATLPNSTLYQSMINAGTLIAAKRSDRLKYMGQIYERQTLMVAAR